MTPRNHFHEQRSHRRAVALSLAAALVFGAFAGADRCAAAAPPVITVQPLSQQVPPGGTAVFNVGATGAALGYQWRFFNPASGTSSNLTGQTSSNLVVTNLQPANEGFYSVVITNVAGATNSADALLKVFGTAACLPPPPGLIAWWPGNSNTTDIIGGYNGHWVGITNYSPGEVNTAFNISPTNYVDVPDNINLTPTNALTVDAWIFPSSAQDPISAPIVKKAGRGPPPVTTAQQQTGFSLEFFGPTEVTLWVYVPAASPIGWVQSPTPTVPANTWTYVTGVYDGTNVSIYLNGLLQGSTPAPGGIVPSVDDLGLGHDVSNPGRFYNGLIDEPGIYNRALSPAEILAVYNAGHAGKCLPPVAPALVGQPDSQPPAKDGGDGSTPADPSANGGGGGSVTPLLTAGSPVLSIGQTNGGLVLSWPASAAGYVLESTDDLTSANWTGVSAPAVTNATDVSVLVVPSNSWQFYRLRQSWQ